jgi:hypothetical protein
MHTRLQVEDWIRGHRAALLAGWAAVGGAFLAWMALRGPDVVYLRGAPWPLGWMMLFFVSLWGWVALRFIALWIWAWVVMALAPVCLFVPLRFYLDAWWLLPLLVAIAAASALTVVAVVAWQLRRRRRAPG